MIDSCAPAFGNEPAFQRGRRHLLAQLVGLGRHTISSLLRTQNRHRRDWSADYRLYSRARFDPQALFGEVRRGIEALLPAGQPLVVSMDDSLLRKSGRRIHGVRWQRDPLSPAFQVNLVRGLRVLQISAALPRPEGAARMVPVDFQHAVLPAKPSRKATAQELEDYKQLKAQKNINRLGRQRLEALRRSLDQDGSAARPLVAAVDGRFTNRSFLEELPERTSVVGRLRKDAVLYALPEQQPPRGRHRKYGALQPTPRQLLEDEQAPFQRVEAFAAGKRHAFQVKEMGPVLLRLDRGARTVRIIVVRALGYRLKKGGKLLYRQPAFLMCTDPEMPLEEILQDYLWRWDIEVNFRDEKTLLGVGQAQVRTQASNQNAPALAVAAYAMLLLAAIRSGEAGTHRQWEAKWYRRSPERRPSTNELINQLRWELWGQAINQAHLSDFTTEGPPDQKSDKCPVPLPSALFLTLA